jgi:uncharacterized membrane protein
MLKNFEKNLVLYLAIVLTIFTVLPILAPIFAHLKLNFLADPIYWVYQWFCHQRPWRSYHLFDYQFAMDARMMLMFGSMAIGAFMIHFKNIQPLKIKNAFLLAILFTLPLAVDGVIQMIAELSVSSSTDIPFYESTNFIRSLTGLLLGTGIAYAVFPFLKIGNTSISKFGEIMKYVLINMLLSFLLIPTFVFFWHITSTKYKPGWIFIDHVQRFPGYNYEITPEGGHTSIKRLISLPVTTQIERANRYNREDLIEEYEEANLL